jgi:SpoVK/Ycf46/Vps4 family AAA+-type ATPase
VQKMLQVARQLASCILFMDDINAMPNERSSSSEIPIRKMHTEMFTQILIALDNMTVLKNVIFIAATEQPDQIKYV